MFIQIAVAVDPNGETLYALTDNGIIYEKRVKFIHPTASASGRPEYVSWWSKVDLPFAEPMSEPKQ